MNYLYLIKKLFSFELYQKYRHHIKVDKDQREIYWLFKALDQMMEKFQKDISQEDYALWVQVNLGNEYVVFLNLIKETNADEEVIEEALQELRTRSVAHQMAERALAVSEGKAPVEELSHIYEQLAQSRENEKVSQFVTTDLEELYDESFKHPGLRWRLNSLNRSLGSLRHGDFGFIFARPETGKTTFLASEVSFFAQQSNGPILWFNNEEQHRKVMIRIILATLGITMQQLATDLHGYQERYREMTGDRIKIPNLSIMHRREVDAICKEVRPSLVVIDQLSKVKGFNNDRHDLQLGATFEWARELAKEYCPVIGVNQADGSAEGKKYLTMDNVANSKTAVQAEADFILGIGKSNDAGFELIRHLNISKNKLLGDEDSNPAMRHGKIDVLIQPEIARYRDIE